MTLTNPLPDRLAPPPNGLVIEDVYQSTTSSAYNYKPQDAVLGQPTFRKAPSNAKVHYTLDTLEKVWVASACLVKLLRVLVLSLEKK